MAAPSLRVIFTQSAWSDLEEIVAYWTERDEPEHGDGVAMKSAFAMEVRNELRE